MKTFSYVPSIVNFLIGLIATYLFFPLNGGFWDVGKYVLPIIFIGLFVFIYGMVATRPDVDSARIQLHTKDTYVWASVAGAAGIVLAILIS